MKKIRALVGIGGPDLVISEGEVQEWTDYRADYFLDRGLVERAEEPQLTRSEVINRFGEDLGQKLIDAGHSSLSSLVGLSKSALMDIPGVGKVSAEKILDELQQ